MYFAVEKIKKIKKHQQRSNFFNDWTKISHILSQNLKQVTKKGENYCARVKRSGVYSWVPLEPHPSAADVVATMQH